MISLSGLAPQVRKAAAYALQFARAENIPVRVTSTRRSLKDQRDLYNNYLAGRSQYPAAPPGSSAHEFGLAFDSVVPAAYQDRWNEIRRAIGFQVLEQDIIHAQVPGWENVARRQLTGSSRHR